MFGAGLALRIGGILAILGAIHGAFWYAKKAGRDECERAHAQSVAKEFREHVEAVAEIANESQRMAARRVANRGLAVGAADRLRGAIAGNGLVNHSSPAASSPATGEATDLSARLFDWADERLRILAEYADEASAAGSACERAWDSLRR